MQTYCFHMKILHKGSNCNEIYNFRVKWPYPNVFVNWLVEHVSHVALLFCQVFTIATWDCCNRWILNNYRMVNMDVWCLIISVVPKTTVSPAPIPPNTQGHVIGYEVIIIAWSNSNECLMLVIRPSFMAWIKGFGWFSKHLKKNRLISHLHVAEWRLLQTY